MSKPINVIYVNDFSRDKRYNGAEMLVAPSFTHAAIAGYKRRKLDSFTWGAFSPKFVKRAKKLNARQKALADDQRAFEADLKASQAALIEEGKS